MASRFLVIPSSGFIVFVAADLAAGAPTVPAVLPVVTYGFPTANALAAGAPTLGQGIFGRNLAANGLTDSAPTIPAAAMAVVVNAVANNLAAGSPTVPAATMVTFSNFVATPLSAGLPALGSARWVKFWVSSRVIDGGLDLLRTEANEMWLLYAFPPDAPTYADAVAQKLGSAPAVFGSIGDVAGGRRLASAAITHGTCTAVGDAHRWAMVDTVNSRLLAAGNLTSDITTVLSNEWLLDPVAVVRPGA